MGPDYSMHKGIINNLCPELLNYPFNPPAPFIAAIKRIINNLWPELLNYSIDPPTPFVAAIRKLLKK